ncbi:MAG: hydrogenase maturation protease [Burkholderiales bacterium]
MSGTAVICCGNPSRGDDALGQLFFDRLEKASGEFEVFCDYQLQIEHVFDMNDREFVIFVDAAVDIAGPFEMREIFPERDMSHSTHALSPAALLGVYEKVMKRTAPKAYLLSVKGESFGLGEPLSVDAQKNLDAAWGFLQDFMELKSDLGKAAIPG